MRLKEIVHNWIDNHSSFAFDTDFFPAVQTKYGDIFNRGSQLECIKQAGIQYRFEDIAEKDIILDIGANVGGFTIRAAKLAFRVIAVEPIYFEELNKNLHFNSCHENVKVIPAALGLDESTRKKISFGKMSHDAPVIRFDWLIKEFSPTFLKCDCEGAEGYINPEDLDGIGKIEMEFHWFNRSSEMQLGLDEKITSLYRWIKGNYRCDEEVDKVTGRGKWNGLFKIVHARKR